MKFLKRYFITFYIIKGLSASFFLSFFIYEAYFHFSLPFLDTLLGLIGLSLLLTQKKEINFWSGFFTGIFWFYWIALSFRYYDMSYMMPFVVLSVGVVYALIFTLISYPSNPFTRALFILFLSYFHPFGFSWLKPELIFVNSYIGVEKWQFTIVLFSISLSLFLYKKGKRYIFAVPLILILFSFDLSHKKPASLDMNISLYDQKLPQQIKWDPRYKEMIIDKNFQAIKRAIKEKKEMIVLNESAFPIYLNTNKKLLDKLKQLSKHIIIITGALKYTKKGYYNSTYYFINSKVTIADKVVLVPFGEEIPLPKFLRDFINRIFFDGAEDFKTAKQPTQIKIKGKTFTNAICYEATEDIIYKNHPRYVIAISNNAWFTPSIEPTLQNLLLKYYSKIYHTTILHAANMGISGIIYP